MRSKKSSPARPRYQQIADTLRREMQSDALRPGDRLPSFAEMSAQFGATPTTVTRVHHVLEQQGLIRRERGRGVFVASPPRRAHGVLGVLGLALAQPEQALYWSLLLSGIRQGAEAAGRELLLLGDATPSLGWEKVDGILAVGEPDETLRRLPPGMTAVLLLSACDELSSVMANDAGGMRLATEHLIELGHRRIAFLVQSDSDFVSRRRLSGYHAALYEAGIEPRAEWVRTLEAGGGELFETWGRRRMAQWLQDDWHSLGCTALLTQNDHTAIGAIGALREAGLRVPADVSVVGFDGTPFAEHFTPRLSTVQVPLCDIGRRGVTRLIEALEQDASNGKTDVLPVQFKTGESSAPRAKSEI